MGDEDDRKAACLQRADHLEHLAHFVAVKAGGRLVKHQDLSRQLHRAGNRHDLLDGDGIGPKVRPHVDLQPIGRQNIARPRLDQALADQAEPGGLVAEEQVFGDRPVGQQVHLLIDRADPCALRLQGVAEGDRTVLKQYLAAVGLIGAGQDLDQRGLARAVLAEQRVNLARPHLEVHLVQRAVLAEDLAHLPRLQHRHL